MEGLCDDRGIIEWQIFHLAHALTRAKRLEKHRAEFFEGLYESIVYPKASLDYNNPAEHSSKTDNQAIRILETKERYDKKVQQEYEKHFRWKDLLDWANEKDRVLMVRYFQKKKYIEPHIILGLLDRLEERIEHEEFMMDKEGNERAHKAFKIHRKDFMDKYRRKALLIKSKLETRLVDGRFVEITSEEYEQERQTQADKMEQFRKEILKRREVAT